MQESKKKEEKKRLPRSVRYFLVALFSIGGTALAIYVAGWVMFLEPLISLYHQFQDHTVRFRDVFMVAISIFMAATAGGGIWCGFDILANFFRDRED